MLRRAVRTGGGLAHAKEAAVQRSPGRPGGAPAAASAHADAQAQPSLDMDTLFPELVGTSFRVLERIGEGTFACVYRAIDETSGREVALKRIYPTSGPWRIFNEIGYLRLLQGGGSVVALLEGIRREDQVTLVLPYFAHEPFHAFYQRMSIESIRAYMLALMRTLAFIHSRGVMHRDIKPSNFLYSPATGRYLLVDFGLAEYDDAAMPVGSAPGEADGGDEPESATAADEADAALSAVVSKIRENAALHGAKRGRVRARSPTRPAEAPAAAKRHKALDGSAQVLTYARRARAASSSASAPASARARAAAWSACELSPAAVLAWLRATDSRQFYKPAASAARAGTRGFRAPEVLVKHARQGVAVDVWSAGVVLLCLLTRRYPFFEAQDDFAGLAEIACLLGADALRRGTAALGRVCLAPAYESRPLAQLCAELNPSLAIPPEAIDLLARCLEVDPASRISAAQALAHPFLAAGE